MFGWFKKVRSRIWMHESVGNKSRKFGSGTTFYPCYIDTGTGVKKALFSIDQLRVAMQRAAGNPEDWPQ